MKEETENHKVELKVKSVESRQDIPDQFFAQLPVEIFQKLKIHTHDIIQILGNGKVTAAVAQPTTPAPSDRETIRMGKRLRENAGVSGGEKVTIQKAHERPARKIVLALPGTRTTRSDLYAASFLKRALLHCPLSAGDLVYIPTGPTTEVPVQVLSAQPEGIVVVRQRTILKVRMGDD